jgi:hypothetical protein
MCFTEELGWEAVPGVFSLLLPGTTAFHLTS